MSQQRILQAVQARRALRKKIEIPGGFTTEPNGHELLVADVYLDHTDLEALVIKAGGNKKGKSKQGALHVVITSRRRVAVLP